MFAGHVTAVHSLANIVVHAVQVPFDTAAQLLSHPLAASVSVSKLFAEQVTDVHPLASALLQVSQVPPGTSKQLVVTVHVVPTRVVPTPHVMTFASQPSAASLFALFMEEYP